MDKDRRQLAVPGTEPPKRTRRRAPATTPPPTTTTGHGPRLLASDESSDLWAHELFPREDVTEGDLARYREREAKFGAPTHFKVKRWDPRLSQWILSRAHLDVYEFAEIDSAKAFAERFGGGRWRIDAYALRRAKNGMDSVMEPMRSRVEIVDTVDDDLPDIDEDEQDDDDDDGDVSATLVPAVSPAPQTTELIGLMRDMMARAQEQTTRAREEERAAFTTQLSAQREICQSAIEMVKAAHSAPAHAAAPPPTSLAEVIKDAAAAIAVVGPIVMPFLDRVGGAIYGNAAAESSAWRGIAERGLEVVGQIGAKYVDAKVSQAAAAELDAAVRAGVDPDEEYEDDDEENGGAAPVPPTAGALPGPTAGAARQVPA